MPGRLLRLLALLQTRREWSGGELATRLGVTDRTVRRDIERLRALDYPVTGTTGTTGGYRLAAGRDVPPLVLDDEEALAVAVGLVTAAGGGVAGVEDSSMRALVKLEQVLPARLRPRLVALTQAMAAMPVRRGPRADPGVLVVLAACCRDDEMVSFDYRGRAGVPGARRVEPHSLVVWQGLWYLVAFDPDRAGWRTFRVDRITGAARTFRRFEPHELPAVDAAGYLAASFAGARYRHTARLTVALAADAVRDGVFASIPGEVEAVGSAECVVGLTAETPELVVQFVLAIAALGAEFTVAASTEVAERIRVVGVRLTDRVS